MDSTNNFQENFTLCSFVGDYRGALNFATKHAISQGNRHKSAPSLSPEDLLMAKKELERLTINSDKNNAEQNTLAKMLSHLIDGGEKVEDVFKDKTQVSAKRYIIAESGKYHFLLLNESHYSSQNREFTRELLKPLWEKGYRYLALETLGYTDTLLMQRGYPIVTTGYYTKESVFGNLVREALSIGYKVIPYEAKISPDYTPRDGEQARNIYNATLKNDSIGKVIIHAGYSHISEFPGVDYKPMGFQLGQLVDQPIFTIDQQEMTELSDDKVLNAYYRYAVNTFKFNEPVVFLSSTGIPLTDPTAGVDVEVYHPRTTYIKGRPSWLLSEEYRLYDLSPEILTFKGNLIQATIQNEDPLSVPVDQIVIKEGNALILKKGNYSLHIIDCNGSLIGEATLKVR
jgi:hypothetical protein